MFGDKKILGLIAFNALYLIGYIIYYLSIGNYEFMIYIGVVVLLGLIVLGTLKYSKLDFVALWGLSIWSLLHMLGGSLPVGDSVLYRYKIIELINRGGDFYVLKMDQVIHFYGFLVAAVVVYQLLTTHFREVRASPKMAIFVAWIGSMGLGALNEVVEFIAYVSLSQTGVGDMYNTGLDLIFNMFGALAGAYIQYLRTDKQRRK